MMSLVLPIVCCVSALSDAGARNQKIGPHGIGIDQVLLNIEYDDVCNVGPSRQACCWGLCIGAGGGFGCANHSWAISRFGVDI